ncbi:MAG: hypothetical protein V4650_03675 [Pseudomonadota bacterium]
MKLVLPSLLILLTSGCVLAPANYPGAKSGSAGGDTVLLCHKGKKTMELPSGAASAHFDHGDRRGAC